MELLAILGRGIQRLSPDGPWALTEDLEVCDERSAHLPVRVPVDDENPYCMVGGGEMNLEAGWQLILRSPDNPKVVVCAYGDRSDYLKSVDGPTESEVMSERLTQIFRRATPSPPEYLWPEIVTWSRTRSLPIPSNTGQEIRNIFDLALERGLKTVVIVTIGVHLARTGVYVGKCLSREKRYDVLSVRLFESEEVLVAADPANWPRVEALRTSKAFARNWVREADGIQKIVRDVYGDVKPPVTAS